MDAGTFGDILEVVGLIFVGGIVVWIALFFMIRDSIKERRKDRERLAAWEAAAPEREAEEAAKRERAWRAEDPYGPAHQALRRGWKEVIRQVGADCMERECLMPSRRIPAGAAWDEWDLAHDHEAEGNHNYLGPAHKVCNQAEALRRGVTWEGAPTLEELPRSLGDDEDDDDPGERWDSREPWARSIKFPDSLRDPWAAPEPRNPSDDRPF